MESHLSTKRKYIPHVFAGISGYRLIKSIYGKKVYRVINGQTISYFLKELSDKQAKEHMFEPRIKESMLKYRIDNLKSIHSRNPISLLVFALSCGYLCYDNIRK